MSNRIPVTREEVLNNYEYKVTKRIVMDKFPWITDITIYDEEEDINKYGLIFLLIHYDLKKFIETYDQPPAFYLTTYVDKNYTASHISTGFRDMEYEEGRDIEKDIDKLMNDVRNTPAIPDELKLPKGRRLTPGGYTTKVPPDIWKYLRKSY
jgi:hypothetical protein